MKKDMIDAGGVFVLIVYMELLDVSRAINIARGPSTSSTFIFLLYFDHSHCDCCVSIACSPNHMTVVTLIHRSQTFVLSML